MRASEREDMELAVREGRFVEVAEVNPKPSISDLYILDANQYNNKKKSAANVPMHLLRV